MSVSSLVKLTEFFLMLNKNLQCSRKLIHIASFPIITSIEGMHKQGRLIILNNQCDSSALIP